MNVLTRLKKKNMLFARLNDAGRKGEMSALFLVPFLVILISLIVFFIIREERRAGDAHLSELRESAEAFYEQIAVARIWNAKHGGVYAEVTPETQPNPYLDAAGRDIVSIDGRRYTKINPAYMTRQLSEIADKRHGNKFRIIGIRPLNPLNVPEAWETEALQRMEKAGAGAAESLFREEDGKRYFKYLAPLRIEQPCLACHAKQGFRLGDMKGGVVISIPMEKFDAIHKGSTKKTVISMSVVGSVSILFTVLITTYLSRRLTEEIRKNIEREKLVVAVELAGAAAHEMRQPMTIVHCMLDIVKEKLQRSETLKDEDMEIIHGQCDRMNGIIGRLLNITQYRTKKYSEWGNIMDIQASSAGEGPGAERGAGA